MWVENHDHTYLSRVTLVYEESQEIHISYMIKNHDFK